MNSVLSFFKVFLIPDSSQKLYIPPEFVERIGRALPNQVALRNRHGKLWLVTISRDGNYLFLGEGWPKFIQDNVVKHQDFLVFRYDGELFFNVKLYGRSACERTLILPNACFHMASEEAEEMEVDGSENEDESKDENSEETNDIYVSESESEEESEDQYFEVKDNGLKFAKTSTRDDNKAKAEGESSHVGDDEDEVFKHGIVARPRNPYFIAKLRESRKNELYVPLDVIKDHRLDLPPNIYLIDEESRGWKAKVVPWKDGRTWLTDGWKAFKKWNNFKEDDRCICEFVNWRNRDTIYLKMTILRAKSWLPNKDV